MVGSCPCLSRGRQHSDHHLQRAAWTGRLTSISCPFAYFGYEQGQPSQSGLLKGSDESEAMLVWKPCLVSHKLQHHSSAHQTPTSSVCNLFCTSSRRCSCKAHTALLRSASRMRHLSLI